MTAKYKTTVRLSEDLNKQLSEYAKVEEMSKNQVVKRAIKKFLEESKREVS